MLTGNFHVKPIEPSLRDVDRLFNTMRNKMDLRRLVLGLRWWPTGTDEHEEDLNLNWSVVRGVGGHSVYELRIQETIGGHNNLRVIFCVDSKVNRDGLPFLHVLFVFQKKRNDFTSAQLNTMRLRRDLALGR